ncbi:MAG: SAM-dependent methyltransferase [Prosthecobacter sp.]
MTAAAKNETDPELRAWLVRVPEIFEGIAGEVLKRFGAETSTRLGHDYYLIKTLTPKAIQQSEEAKFARWNLPMDHTWPCNAQKMDGFIEKAAQTLLKKFGERKPQGIFIGQLNPTSPDKYYKSLASNLRGRVLQIFPKLNAATVEEQDPTAETLFCLVGKEGLFCGMQSPRASNGLYAGGSKYIDQDSPDTISRAGAKIAEALHYLLMHRPALPAGSHWVELGACPGGMTSELLAREQRVTAIDRAPLDQRLNGRAGLKFVHADVATFEPRDGAIYDAILSDLNGPPEESMSHVIRLSHHLKTKGLVVFTLKIQRVETVDEPCALFRKIVKTASTAGLQLFAQTHLTYNRHEFTLFLEKARA